MGADDANFSHKAYPCDLTSAHYKESVIGDTLLARQGRIAIALDGTHAIM
jgi:hypothetical protein